MLVGGNPPPSLTNEASLSSPLDPPPTYTSVAPAQDLKPVAIPQTSDRHDSPFVRAYAPQLETSGVSEEVWLAFVDGLSQSMIMPPLAGPSAPSHGYLDLANAEYFQPRGLSVQLMNGDELSMISGKTEKYGRSSTMDKLGREAEAFFTTVRLPIVSPIAARVLDIVKPLPRPTGQATSPQYSRPRGNPFVERRMSSMQPYIAPVTFEVSPSGTSRNATGHTMHNPFQRTYSPTQRQSKEDSLRALLAISRGQISAHDYAWSLERASGLQERRAYKDERRFVKKAFKQERHVMKGKGTGDLERRVRMAERREMTSEDKLMWLVVTPVAIA